MTPRVEGLTGMQQRVSVIVKDQTAALRCVHTSNHMMEHGLDLCFRGKEGLHALFLDHPGCWRAKRIKGFIVFKHLRTWIELHLSLPTTSILRRLTGRRYTRNSLNPSFLSYSSGSYIKARHTRRLLTKPNWDHRDTKAGSLQLQTLHL